MSDAYASSQLITSETSSPLQSIADADLKDNEVSHKEIQSALMQGHIKRINAFRKLPDRDSVSPLPDANAVTRYGIRIGITTS